MATFQGIQAELAKGGYVRNNVANLVPSTIFYVGNNNAMRGSGFKAKSVRLNGGKFQALNLTVETVSATDRRLVITLTAYTSPTQLNWLDIPTNAKTTVKGMNRKPFITKRGLINGGKALSSFTNAEVAKVIVAILESANGAGYGSATKDFSAHDSATVEWLHDNRFINGGKAIGKTENLIRLAK